MDVRSPLSPRTLNTQRVTTNSAPEKLKGGPQKARLEARSVKLQSAETLERKQSAAKTRRFSFVSWLANFEGKEMKGDSSQQGVILSQQDHNLRAAEKVQSSQVKKQTGKERMSKDEFYRDDTAAKRQLAQPVSADHEAQSILGQSGSREEQGTSPLADSQEEDRNSHDEDAKEDDVDWDSLPSEEDIATYAEYLGMKPKEDKELRWIAEQAMLCPLPDGWQEGVDKDGATYFYELDNMTSYRAHPCDNDYKFLYRGLRRALRESAVTFEAVVVMADHLGIDVATEPHLLWIARHALLAPLLPGWEELDDEEGSYFYDRRKETATGTHPIDAFFQRLIVTERMKRKEKGKDSVASKDKDACIMELLDEASGELYAFDWSKAEMHESEPDTDGNETDSHRVDLVALWQGVAGPIWEVPLRAWAMLMRTWSTVFPSRLQS